MSEATHRLVNGERVELTPEQKAEIEAHWSLWDEKKAKKQKVDDDRQEMARNIRDKLGLTNDECKMLGMKIK